MVKAGVVIVNRFVKPGSKEYASYIDYIDRNEAVRQEHLSDFNLFNEYMGNPEKSTGLFTDDKSVLTKGDKQKLKEVFQTAHDNGSLMWQTVISFDNAWLRDNGIFDENFKNFNEEKMKEISRGAIRTLLSSENLTNAVWTASFHYNTDNIHLHIAIVEPEPMRRTKEYVQYQYIGNSKGEYIKLSNGSFVKSNNKNSINKYGVPYPRYDRVPIKEKGKILKKQEHVGRFSLSSMEACKKHVVDQIVVNRENNILINNIIRKQIVRAKKAIYLSQDQDLAKQFIAIHKKLPRNCSRNLWKYNSNILMPLRNEIDKLSDQYMQKYHAEDIKKLESLLHQQSEVYRTAYGDTGRNFAETKQRELRERLGNAILSELREYDKNVTENPEEKYSPDLSKIDQEILYMEEEQQDIDMENIQEPGSIAFEKKKQIRNIIDTDIHILDVERDLKKAKEYYEQSKSKLSDFQLGNMYFYGKEVEQDYKLALKYYERAEDNPYAMYKIGMMYEKGIGVEEDHETSVRYYKKAFNLFQEIEKEQGDDNTAYRLGRMYLSGKGCETDYKKAEDYFEKSSKAGNPYAQYELAKLYLENGDSKNTLKAISLLEKSAGKGNNKMAKYALGKLYLKQGEFYNPDTAIKWLNASLETDSGAPNADAAYTLAKIYLDLASGYYDEVKGIDYLKIAAKSNNKYAAYSLGKLLMEHDSLQDQKEGIQWMNQAAKAGNTMALYRLGTYYLDENSHFYNQTEAINYLRLAAEKGNSYAQSKMGFLCLKGDGLQKDIKAAKRYFSQSAENGNEFAEKVLNDLNTEKVGTDKIKIKSRRVFNAQIRRSMARLRSAMRAEKEKALNEKIFREYESNRNRNTDTDYDFE